VVRRERDLNSDGRIDVWEFNDAEGNPEKQVLDLDFDGKADVNHYFEKGQLVRKEMSFGFDGKPSITATYEAGKLTLKEKDDNGDGKVDAWEYWENGELDRIGFDTDGDGKVDRWEARKTAPTEPARPAEAAK
jgi:antitoxin component YwqK of YwqJK toxin-antitoxin module